MAYPNLIIGGAPKCGTSSLYFWLASHPEVCASRIKETFYFADNINRFNKGSNFIENGLEGYQRHFEKCSGHKIIFEATAAYIYMRNALEQIPALPGDPKMIFMVREPASRALSQYLFQRDRLGNITESFEEFLKRPMVINQSQYVDYLSKWKEKLHDRMKVYVFEEFMKDPRKGMQDISEFLDIDGNFYKTFSFTQRNETVKMKNPKLHKLGLKVQQFIPHRLQEILLPLYMKVNSSGKSVKTEEEKQIMKQWKSYFEKHNADLQNLFPYLDISSWSK